MHLIVGLGNPGKKYEQTRHNVGFLVVDELARQLNATFKNKTSFEAEVAEMDNIALMKPQTFMNVSGRSVKAFLAKHKCNASDILVIYDDADIPFGDVKFKQGGSSAGHNGMQSIIDAFPKGTAIARIRIGIGRPAHADVPLDVFVLQKWTSEEAKKLPEMISQTIVKVHEKITSTPNPLS
ncbi:MAG: aminoacyl-tRNA hydrolase [Candidatus Uhrbacteria bacterium]|nr:aminoacyl-tRNA hydrolase [Candidatus Uhrbacteria bacterium]